MPCLNVGVRLFVTFKHSVCSMALAKENLVCPAAMACANVTVIVSMFVWARVCVCVYERECVFVWLLVPSEGRSTSEQPKKCHWLTELVLPLHTHSACVRGPECACYVSEGGNRQKHHNMTKIQQYGTHVRRPLFYIRSEQSASVVQRCVCVCLILCFDKTSASESAAECAHVTVCLRLCRGLAAPLTLTCTLSLSTARGHIFAAAKEEKKILQRRRRPQWFWWRSHKGSQDCHQSALTHSTKQSCPTVRGAVKVLKRNTRPHGPLSFKIWPANLKKKMKKKEIFCHLMRWIRTLLLLLWHLWEKSKGLSTLAVESSNFLCVSPVFWLMSVGRCGGLGLKCSLL